MILTLRDCVYFSRYAHSNAIIVIPAKAGIHCQMKKKRQQFKSRKENISGVILLDKPTGMSSNQALQKVKWIFQARKAGHTGSLDPLATGLLPLCFGQATKVSQYLLDSHKKYTTVIKLGEVTDTLDSEGEVTKVREVDVTDQQIQDALNQFKGNIKQVPPMYSALKKDGNRFINWQVRVK